jgi:hypothetical protein
MNEQEYTHNAFIPEDAPLSFGRDPKVTHYLGLDTEGDGTPNFHGMSKMLGAGVNLSGLLNLADDLEAAKEQTVKTAEVTPPDPDENEETAPDVDSTSNSPEEDNEDVADTGEDFNKLMENIPEEVSSNPTLKKMIIDNDPSKSRSFYNFLSRGKEDSESIPAETSEGSRSSEMKDELLKEAQLKAISKKTNESNNDFETLATLFGHYSNKKDSFIKDLHLAPNKELINDPYLGRLAEGVNRALNIFARNTSYNRSKGFDEYETPATMLTGMVDHLTSHLPEELEAYRKAGNFATDGDDRAPNLKQRSRSSVYVKMMVPHMGDNYLSPEGQARAHQLSEDIRSFIKANKEKTGSTASIRVKTVRLDWAANITPTGMPEAVSAMVLNVGNHQFMDESEVAVMEHNPKEGEVKEGEVKTAYADGITDANSFAQEHGFRPGSNSSVLSMPHLYNLFLKWLSKVALDGGTLNPAVTQELQDISNRVLGDAGTKAEVEKWLHSKQDEYHVMGSDAQDLVNELTTVYRNRAKELAKAVDRYFEFMAGRDSWNSFGQQSLSRLAKDSFFKALPSLLIKCLNNPIPEQSVGGINNWIVQEAMEIEGKGSSASHRRDVANSLIAELLRDTQTSGNTPEDKWEGVSVDYTNDPTNNHLQVMLGKWEDFLKESLDNKNAVRFEENRDKIAETINKGIVAYIANSSPAKLIKEMVSDILTAGTPSRSLPRISPTDERVIPTEKVKGNKNFGNLVYLTSNFYGKTPGMKTLSIQPHKEYDLVVGTFSAIDNPKKGRGGEDQKDEPEAEGSSYLSGFILQVKDGRPVVNADDARLEKNEIARFLEFVARSYAAKVQEEHHESIESQNVEGDNGEVFNRFLDRLSTEMKDLGYDHRSLLFNDDMVRALKNATVEERADILENLHKERQYQAALQHNRAYGSRHSINPATGEIQSEPSRVEKIFTGDEHSPYKPDLTDNTIEKISKSLASKLPSMKSIDTQGMDPKGALTSLMATKEVAEDLVRRALHIDGGVGANIYPTLEALFQASLKKALIETGNSEFLVVSDKTSKSSGVSTNSKFISDVAKMVKDANSKYGQEDNAGIENRRQYSQAWEDAKSKDPSLFNKLFVPHKSAPSLRTGSKYRTADNMKKALVAIAESMPTELMSVEGASLVFADDGLGTLTIQDKYTDSKGVLRNVTNDIMAKVLDTFIQKYYNNLLEATHSKDSQTLDEHLSTGGLFSSIVIGNVYKDEEKADGLEVYDLREKAMSPEDEALFADELKKFLEENDKGMGTIGRLIPSAIDKRINWASTKAGLTPVKFKMQTATKKVDLTGKNKGKDPFTQATKKGLETLLTAIKDSYGHNREAQELLGNATDIAKVFASNNRREEVISGTSDLNVDIKGALANAHEKLNDAKKKQNKTVMKAHTQGEVPVVRTDYTNPKVIVDFLTKDLINSWLHKKPLQRQYEIKYILSEQFKKNVDMDQLYGPDANKVLIKVAEADTRRPRPSFGSRRGY